MTKITPSSVKPHFVRRAIIPFITLSCILIYAIMFILYLNHSNDSSINIETHNKLNPVEVVIQSPLQNTKQRRRTCNILVAHGGDEGAGFATLIYAYPINFILYAQKYNYTLWLDYNPSYNDLYYDKLYGNNTFEYYFSTIHPNWHLCDKHKSNYKILSLRDINPGIHKREIDSIHLWYYHFKVQNIKHNPDEYLNNWYYEQRYRGSQIVDKYFHLKSDIMKQRDNIWIYAFGNNYQKYEILGVQMRGSDKVQRWSIRRTVAPEEYMPYIASFIDYYKDMARIFFATDDKNYLKFLETHWNEYIDMYSFDDVVITQGNVTRSSDKTAVFDFKDVSKYAIGREVLLDILLLAKCDWFIHSASAVSEAVFFNNIKLHNYSIHLEYTVNRQVPFWFKSGDK
eukprot:216073_1